MLELHTQLKGFVVNGVIYAREGIQISTAAHVDSAIRTGIGPEMNNEAGRIADRIMGLPETIMWIVVRSLKWLNRRGILPASILAASLFHASVFLSISNLSS